jgi:uncharacterized membrane protein YeaQ/YmgE (transglycosylase-associated protein family)
MPILVLLVLGALCGVLAELLLGYGPGGFVASAVIGLVGALAGAGFARAVALPGIVTIPIGEQRVEAFWAVVGAAVLLAAVSMVYRGTIGRPDA